MLFSVRLQIRPARYYARVSASRQKDEDSGNYNRGEENERQCWADIPSGGDNKNAEGHKNGNSAGVNAPDSHVLAGGSRDAAVAVEMVVPGPRLMKLWHCSLY